MIFRCESLGFYIAIISLMKLLKYCNLRQIERNLHFAENNEVCDLLKVIMVGVSEEDVSLIITNYSQQDTTFLDLIIFTDALHVSGGFSAHHHEHITVHTASGIVNQYCCRGGDGTQFHLLHGSS
jgi:hypothetical protein